MLVSSQGRRARGRWQRLATAAICATSFLTGDLLFGQQLTGARPQLQRAAIEAVPMMAKPGVEARPVSNTQSTDELAPIVSSATMPRPARNKPAATQPVVNNSAQPATPSAVNAAEQSFAEKWAAEKLAEKTKANASAPLPAGTPATTGPWMQDIREMIRATPAPKNGAAPAVNAVQPNAANKNVAKQVKYEKAEAVAPAGPPKELIATPLGNAQSAFAPAAVAPAPAPVAVVPAAPMLAPPPAVAELKAPVAAPEARRADAAPLAAAPAQLAPAPAMSAPAPQQPVAPEARRADASTHAVATTPKPKKLQHLAPMNPQYEAAAQARGIAQVKAENSLSPYAPPGQFNNSLTPAPTFEPSLQTPSLNGQPVNLVQQPAQPGLQPLVPTPNQPMHDPRVDAMARAGSPFEVIDETGAVQVMVRRSKLLRTKVDIYRTAVVDDSICEIVQFTPREVSIIGKSQGSTHVTFWFDDPAMAPITYVIQVVPDVTKVQETEQTYKMLQDVINEMFPDSKIQLMIVADKLIIRGQAKDSEEAAQIVALVRSQTGGWSPGGNAGGWGGGMSEGAAAQVLSDSATGSAQRSRLQVINMLRVPGVQQVALRVKIAELNRSAARGFGVDVKGNVNFTNNNDGAQMFLQSMLNVAAGAGPALLTQVDGDDIQLGVRYLQSHGVIRLLSEPTLVTMSGTPATFIAGGEFAVPTIVGSAGLNAVTTDFRAFGAIISFMPTVIDKDRIRLQVSPEFSQINSQLTVGGTPGLKVRAATTTVEMREGQTLAIAGLLEDNMNGTNVGDLPFLAKVFGRRDMSRNETELLILVAPELVHAMEAEEVPPLPGFDVTEPTSAQFFLHGRLEGNPTQDYRSTVWPRLKKRYGAGGPAMTSGPFGHGQ